MWENRRDKYSGVVWLEVRGGWVAVGVVCRCNADGKDSVLKGRRHVSVAEFKELRMRASSCLPRGVKPLPAAKDLDEGHN